MAPLLMQNEENIKMNKLKMILNSVVIICSQYAVTKITLPRNFSCTYKIKFQSDIK